MAVEVRMAEKMYVHTDPSDDKLNIVSCGVGCELQTQPSHKMHTAMLVLMGQLVGNKRM